MAPITWRNINAPSSEEASRILGRAGNSLQDSLNRFKGLAQQGIAYENKQRDLRTDAFREAVQTGYDTPEKLQEAINSGAINRLRQQYGDIDPARSNAAALRSILSDSREQVVADDRFAQTRLQQRSRPVMDEVDALVAQGQYDQAEALLNSGVYDNEGSAFRSIAEAQRADEARTRADEDRVFNRNVLNERLQRERINFQDKQDAKARTEEQRLKAEKIKGIFDEVINTSVNNWENIKDLQTNYEESFRQELTTLGLNEDLLNNPDGFKAYYDSVSPEQKAKIDDFLTRASLVPKTDATDIRNNAIDKLVASGEYNEQEARQAGQIIDNVLVEGETESKLVEQEKTKSMQGLATKYKDSTLVADYVLKEPPLDKANRLIDLLVDEAKENGQADGISANERQQATKEIIFALTKGVIINGTRLPVSSEMIKSVIKSMSGTGKWLGWLGTDRRVQHVLQDMANDNTLNHEWIAMQNYLDEEESINNFYQDKVRATQRNSLVDTLSQARQKLNN